VFFASTGLREVRPQAARKLQVLAWHQLLESAGTRRATKVVWAAPQGGLFAR
jgi:hypothetical protein